MQTIIIDTREQIPYSFSLTSMRQKLPAGDYSLAGLENQVAVERKSLADFVHTVTRNRLRFYRELEKLTAYDAACIVVEANFHDLLAGNYPGGIHPNAMIGTVISLIVDFKIPVFFCSDRQAACRFVEEFLIRYSKKVERCINKKDKNPQSEDK